jgi:AraC-like DNA-binding protein
MITTEYLPKAERLVYCERTNQMMPAQKMDLSGCSDLVAFQASIEVPIGQPRLIHKTCVHETPVFHPGFRTGDLAKIAVCLEGGALILKEGRPSTYVAPGTAIFTPAGTENDLLLARLPQNWLVAEWLPTETGIPTPQTGDQAAFLLQNCSPFTQQMTRVAVKLGNAWPEHRNFVNAWVNAILHDTHPSPRTFSLSGCDQRDDLLADLIERIKAEPQKNWTLASASQEIGYSPFHLSRIFRQNCEIGLPKFVELTRSEVAINHLLNSNMSQRQIAEQCGFGSPKTMRIAVRKNTGFFPVKIRRDQSIGAAHNLN